VALGKKSLRITWEKPTSMDSSTPLQIFEVEDLKKEGEVVEATPPKRQGKGRPMKPQT